MQGGTLTQCFYPRSFSIFPDLLHRLLPLSLSLRLEILLWQHFEFQNIAMLGSIMGQIRQKEEVTIAVIQFQLRGSIIIIVQIQIRHKEPLQVSFRLHHV